MLLGIGLFVSAIVNILILYCYSWEKIIQKVLQNTTQNVNNNESDSIDSTPTVDPLLKTEPLTREKFILVSKYMITLILSFVIFVPVCYCIADTGS